MKKKTILLVAVVVLVIIAAGGGIWYVHVERKIPLRQILNKDSGKCYTAENFHIQTVKSSVDFNKNGIDDYTDLLEGAKQEVTHPSTYKSEYYSDGYPPDGVGVCTDVIWRAFKQAGYCLKDMVNQDIKENTKLYARVEKPDANIDFRRVPNLKVYFERHAESLTLDTSKIEEWQPGDIVVFSSTHIGMISDKRNQEGLPYLIHNAGQEKREEDALLWQKEITGHYRFDASKLSKEKLIAFK